MRRTQYASVSEDEFRKMKSRLNKEIDRYMKKQETMEHLGKELQKRESIIKQKEEAIARKNQLQLRKLRRSQVVKATVSNLQFSVASLTEQIDSIEKQLEQTGGEDMSLVHSLKEKMEKLDREEQDEEEDEEIAHLQELEEVLDAELERENARIAMTENEAKQLGEKNLEEIISTLPRDELEETLKVFLERYQETRKSVLEQSQEVLSLQVQVSEKNEEIDQLNTALRNMRAQLKTSEENHQKEIHELLKQVQEIGQRGYNAETTSKVSDLERLVKDQHEHLTLMRDEFIKMRNQKNLWQEKLALFEKNSDKQLPHESATGTNKMDKGPTRSKEVVRQDPTSIPFSSKVNTGLASLNGQSLRGAVQNYKAGVSAHKLLLGRSRDALTRRSIREVSSSSKLASLRGDFSAARKRTRSWSSLGDTKISVADITKAVQNM